MSARARASEGITTFTAFAAKWAPLRDKNDPVAYAAFLADFCHWHPDTPVVFETLMPLMVKGVVTRENGRCIYSEDLIRQAIAGVQGKPMTALTPEAPPPPQPVEAPATSWLGRLVLPSASKSAGALVGGYAGQLVCDAIQHYLHLTLGLGDITAITGLCIFAASHILKDQNT